VRLHVDVFLERSASGEGSGVGPCARGSLFSVYIFLPWYEGTFSAWYTGESVACRGDSCILRCAVQPGTILSCFSLEWLIARYVKAFRLYTVAAGVDEGKDAAEHSLARAVCSAFALVLSCLIRCHTDNRVVSGRCCAAARNGGPVCRFVWTTFEGMATLCSRLPWVSTSGGQDVGWAEGLACPRSRHGVAGTRNAVRFGGVWCGRFVACSALIYQGKHGTPRAPLAVDWLAFMLIRGACLGVLVDGDGALSRESCSGGRKEGGRCFSYPPGSVSRHALVGVVCAGCNLLVLYVTPLANACLVFELPPHVQRGTPVSPLTLPLLVCSLKYIHQFLLYRTSACVSNRRV